MNASTGTLAAESLVSSSHVPAELLDSIEVGIAVIDRNFKVQVWNKFLENHSAKKQTLLLELACFLTFQK